MARIYLAASYARLIEVRGYAEKLTDRGHKIVSRWLTSDPDCQEESLLVLTRSLISVLNLEDIDMSDLVISFTESPGSPNTRGGRHVEFGYALGQGKTLFIVGPREHLFHCHERVKIVDSFDELIAHPDFPISFD